MKALGTGGGIGGQRMGRDTAVRMLLGTTLGLHIVLAVLGFALPLYFLTAEYLGLRRGDSDLIDLARRGSRAFAAVFAVGAVTGTLVAAELVILWAPFMTIASQVIILPFFIEGFAFVLEGAFIGMYLYGWDRFRSRTWHLLAGVPIAIASPASGLLITAVNAWMNAPTGFRLAGGAVAAVRPWVAMFNVALVTEDAHVFATAIAMVGMVLLAVAAGEMLRRPESAAARKGASIAAVASVVSLALTVVTGDLSGKWLAVHQPEKLAAIEGLFVTRTNAPEAIGGLVSLTRHTIYGAIDIPGLLSWLSFGTGRHAVEGLLRFPKDTWPPAPIIHLLFDSMVGLGCGMLLLATAYLALTRGGRRPSRLLLLAARLGGAAAVIALECGWLVDELGRQPWVIYGLMRVSAGITRAPGVVPVGWAILGLVFALFLAAPYAAGRAALGGGDPADGGPPA